MTEQDQLTPEKATQYIGELVGEYMKTLPPTVRMPVVQTVNGCLQMITGELSEIDMLRKQIAKLEGAVEKK